MQPCQSHIHQLDPLVFADQDVGRFDIAMHDVTAACMFQGIGNLQGVVDSCLQLQRAVPVDQITNIIALNIFQNDVVPAAIFPHVIDAGNVFMIETCGALRLILKTQCGLLVVAILLQQDLDGDRASKCRVGTPKAGAHTASSDKSIEPKMVQLLALEELP